METQILLAILGGLVLAGIVSATGSDDDDDQDEDRLVTNDITDMMEGTTGGDVLSVTSGQAILEGGDGTDVFVAVGEEGADGPTLAVVTDFDPEEDQLIVLGKQSSVPPLQERFSSENTELVIEEVMTDQGGATQISFVPREGFEDVTDEGGFASIILLGVGEDSISGDNILFGVDRTETDAEQEELIGDLANAELNYEVRQLGGFDDDDLTGEPTPRGTVEGLFGLTGDDRLSGEDFGETDLYGGSGSDDLFGSLGGDGIIDGGSGDDLLVASGDNELTGGEGTDQFRVFLAEADLQLAQLATITDFDLASETLTLAASFDEIAEGTEGDAIVSLENTSIDGVTGTLVTTTFDFDDGRDDVFGPSVFLQGISADDIPDGMFVFDIRFTG